MAPAPQPGLLTPQPIGKVMLQFQLPGTPAVQ
jgi:hypothetical protein